MLHTLIVDDNFYNRDLFKLALDNLGFTHDQAENGLQALEKIKTQKFDLILLDLEMPELDGRGVLEELEKIGILDNFFIVIVTAHAYLIDEYVDVADFVMYKPIDIVLFTEFLRRINKQSAT